MTVFLVLAAVVLLVLWGYLAMEMHALRAQHMRALAMLEELLKSDQAWSAKQDAIRTALTSPDQRAQLRARVAARLGKAGV